LVLGYSNLNLDYNGDEDDDEFSKRCRKLEAELFIVVTHSHSSKVRMERNTWVEVTADFQVYHQSVE